MNLIQDLGDSLKLSVIKRICNLLEILFIEENYLRWIVEEIYTEPGFRIWWKMAHKEPDKLKSNKLHQKYQKIIEIEREKYMIPRYIYKVVDEKDTYYIMSDVQYDQYTLMRTHFVAQYKKKYRPKKLSNNSNIVFDMENPW